ncbi:MAG: NADH-quinone oxidoreductase subunit B family protein [Candidatus Bathyarchaeota archaeon]
MKDLINWIAGRFFNWGRRNSLWPLHIGLACCSIEWAAMGASRFDQERFGLLARSSPRQCDLLFVTGTVTKKTANRIKLLYEQMPEPKYVIALGSCAIAGGPFYDSYSVIQGVDRLFPVDVYVPGCPPRPEAQIYAVRVLQEKIKRTKTEVLEIR